MKQESGPAMMQAIRQVLAKRIYPERQNVA